MNGKLMFKWTLRGCLAILGLVAMFGLWAILAKKEEYTAAIIHTAISTVIAATIILLCLRLLNRKSVQAFTLGVVVWAFVCYVVSLVAIWIEVLFRTNIWFMINRWWPTLAISVFSFPMLLYLLLWPRKGGWVSMWTGLGTSLIVICCSLEIVWGISAPSSHNHDWETQITFSSLAVWISGIIAAACVGGIGGRDRIWWRWPGLVITAIGLGLWLMGIWNHEIGHTWWIYKITTLTLSLGLIIGYINLSRMALLSSKQAWLRWISTTIVLITLFLVNFNMFAEISSHDAWSDDAILWRLVIAGALLAVCGSVAMIIVSIMKRGTTSSQEITEVKEVKLECPICHRPMLVPAAHWDRSLPADVPLTEIEGVSCPNCNLMLCVHVRVPQCQNCGYQLYYLHSKTCPECGTPVNHGRLATEQIDDPAPAPSPTPEAQSA